MKSLTWSQSAGGLGGRGRRDGGGETSWEGLWGHGEGVWVERDGEGAGALGTDACHLGASLGSGWGERQEAPDRHSAPSRADTRPGSSVKSAASSLLPSGLKSPSGGSGNPACRDGFHATGALSSLQAGVGRTKRSLPTVLGAPAAARRPP